MQITPINNFLINKMRYERDNALLNKSVNGKNVSFQTGKINFDKFVTAIYSEVVTTTNKTAAGTYALAYPEEFFAALCKIIINTDKKLKKYKNYYPSTEAELNSNKDRVAQIIKNQQFAKECLTLIPENVFILSQIKPNVFRKHMRDIIFGYLHLAKIEKFEEKAASNLILSLQQNHNNSAKVLKIKNELIKENSLPVIINILKNPLIKENGIISFCTEVIEEKIKKAGKNPRELNSIYFELGLAKDHIKDAMMNGLDLGHMKNQEILERYQTLVNLFHGLETALQASV